MKQFVKRTSSNLLEKLVGELLSNYHITILVGKN